MKDPKSPVKVRKLSTDFITHPGKAPLGEPKLQDVRVLHDELVHHEMKLLGKADRIQYDQIMPKVLTEEFMAERYSNFLADCDLVVLIRHGDVEETPLIGFIALKGNKIMALYIRPDYRRDRVAAGMLTHLQERFHFDEMVVSCYFANEPAQEFYKAAGFVATSHQVLDEKPLFVDYTWCSAERKLELEDLELIEDSGAYVAFTDKGVQLNDYFEENLLQAIVRQIRRNKFRAQEQERLSNETVRRVPLRLVFGTKIEEGTWHEEYNERVIRHVPLRPDTKFAISAEIDGQLVGYVLINQEPNKPALHYHVSEFTTAPQTEKYSWPLSWFGHLIYKYRMRSLTIDVIFDDAKELYRDLVKFGFQVNSSVVKDGKTHLRMEWVNPNPDQRAPYPR